MKLHEILTEGLMGHFEATIDSLKAMLVQLDGKIPQEKHEQAVRWVENTAKHFRQMYHAGEEFEAEDVIDALQRAEIKLKRMLPECEVVYVSEDGEILTEAAQRTFKREGKKIVRKYRCTSGMKEGKVVADPKSCATRKDPAKIRHGRKVARSKKGVRVRKSKIAKRSSMSRMVTRMNKRLSAAKNK